MSNTIEDTLFEADNAGMAPDKQLELIDYWENSTIKQSETELAGEDWKVRQEFTGYLKNQTTSHRERLMKSVTENKIKSYFNDDADESNRFIGQLNEYGSDFAKYDHGYKPLVSSLHESIQNSRSPIASGMTGSVDDDKGNKLVEFSTNFTSDGGANSANVFINKGNAIAGGDVISIPYGFDGIKYRKDKLTKERDAAETRFATLADGPPDALSMASLASQGTSSDEQELLDTMSRTDAELKKLEGLSGSALISARLEGANTYVSDQIKERVESGDEKYKDVGQGTVGALFQTFKNLNQSAYHNLRSSVAALSLGEEIPKAIGNLATGQPGRAAFGLLGFQDEMPQGPVGSAITSAMGEIQKAAKQRLDDVVDNSIIANTAASQKETFSRLAVNKPELAQTFDKISSAVTQGIQMAAEMAVLKGGGLVKAGLQSAGASVEEMTTKADKLRSEGDIESADWIDSNKYALARRKGAYEYGFEKISLGHDPMRSLGPAVGVRAASKEFAENTLGEAGEEGGLNIVSAIDSYVSGMITKEEFKTQLASTPEAAVLGFIGSVIPSGARAVVASIAGPLRKQAMAAANNVVNSSSLPTLPLLPPTETPTPEGATPTAPSKGIAPEGATPPVPSKGTAPVVSQPKGGELIQGELQLDKVSVTERPVINKPPLPEDEDEIAEAIKIADSAKNNVIASENSSSKAVDIVDGTPGDTGIVDVVEKKKRKPRKASDQLTSYLYYIHDLVEAAFKQNQNKDGSFNVSIPFSTNRQEQEVPSNDLVFATRSDTHNKNHKLSEIGLSAIIKKEIEDSDEFKALSKAEQEEVIKKTVFDYYPPFREMSRRGSVVADILGRTQSLSDVQLLKKISSGELDPSKIWWWHDVTTGNAEDLQTEEYSALVQLIPLDRQITLNNSPIGRRVKRDPGSAKIYKHTYGASKAVEQVALKDSGYGVDTVTIGGKSLFSTTQAGELDDMVNGTSIKTEIRDGSIKGRGIEVFSQVIKPVTSGKFVAKESEAKLIAALDKRFGKNNWIMKPNAGIQRLGIIAPWSKENPGLNKKRTQFLFDIPVDAENMYIAQERIEAKREYRINVRVNKDNTITLVPFGIHGGELITKSAADTPADSTYSLAYTGSKDDSSNTHLVPTWGPFGLASVPKEFRDKVLAMIEALQKTEVANDTNNTYGLDVIESTKGELKIIEMNGASLDRTSGTTHGSMINGLLSMVRNNQTPEAMVAFAAYQRVMGQEAIADAIMEDTLSSMNLPAGNKYQDLIDEAYAKGVLFAPEEDLRKTSKAARKAVIDLIEPASRGETVTVSQLLKGIIESSAPIDPYLRALCVDLLSAAEQKGNKGLDVKLGNIKSRRSDYNPVNRKIRLGGTRADLVEVVVHEIMHALSIEYIPMELSAMLLKVNGHPNITGKEVLKSIEQYINKRGGNRLLKNLAVNYVQAVKALGYEQLVFGDGIIDDPEKLPLQKNRAEDNIAYALSDIYEFISGLSNKDFISALKKSKITPTEANYLKRLVNSVLEWMKDTLLKKGSPSNNLFDKSYINVLSWIANDEVNLSKWEKRALSRNNPNTSDLYTQTELNSFDVSNSGIRKQAESVKEIKRIINDAGSGNLTSAQLLESMIESNVLFEPYLIELAKALLDGAKKSNNRGLDYTVNISGRSYSSRKDSTLFLDVARPDSPEIAIHEVMHGLAGENFPSILSGFDTMDKNPDVLGEDVLGQIETFIADPYTDPLLKSVASNYVKAVTDLGYKEDVFGKTPVRAIRKFGGRNGRKDIPYGLIDIHEFMVGISSPKFIQQLKSIEITRAESNSLKRLISSTLEWMKSVLLGKKSPAYTLFDKTYADVLAWVAKDAGKGPRSSSNLFASTESSSPTDPEANPPYRNKRVQKGYLNETSDEIVPKFDLYEIDMPGTKFHNSTITVPVGTDHQGIIDYINKKYDESPPTLYGPPEKINMKGYRIDPSMLNGKMMDQLADVKELIASKAPSDVIDKSLRELKEASDIAEFQLLKQAYPDAFSSKNPSWDGYTSLVDAENAMVDYLFDNPQDALQILGEGKEQQSRARLKLIKGYTSQMRKFNNRLKDGKLTEYHKHPDAVKALVNKAIDWILNIGDPEKFTNRQLTAINLSLASFLETGGYNVRGFSKMALTLYENEESNRLNNLKEELTSDGVKKPFGDPIADWRRNFGPSKTGSSAADFFSEILSIFNRPKTRLAFATLFADYTNGIDAYKVMANEMRVKYHKMIRMAGPTTKLEDHRIGVALFATQYEVNGNDPTNQLLKRASDLEISIQRKEASSSRTDRYNAPIDRQAFDEVISPAFGALQAGVIAYNDYIDIILNALTPQESQLLEIARDPGSLYYSTLDSINQIARGKPIQNWAHYFKQVQHKINNEKMVSSWGQKAMKTADSVLQPREGLGKDSTYSLNWRIGFDWMIEEIAYEYNTGVPRVSLFHYLMSPAFEQTMDGDDSSRPRANRVRAQVGGVHANIKNRELQFGLVAGAALEVTKLSIASKLVSLKAVANQLIPWMNYTLNNHKTASTVFYNVLTDSASRKAVSTMVNRIPDLRNRLQQWDTLIDSFQISQRNKTSGIKKGSAAIIEKGAVALSAIGDLSVKALRSPYGGGALITLTNGVSEVLAAKNVFIGVYIDSLIERGIINNAQDWFNNPIIDDVSVSYAKLMFDTFVLSPISPEFRSELAQKNSGGKVALNLLFTGLLRTATQQSLRSATGLRDVIHASMEVASTRSPESKAFLKDSIKETDKQFINIALYYAIANLASVGLGGVFTATTYVIESILSGEEEDKEKWLRRLRNLEKLNRDMSYEFMSSQAKTDLLFSAAPMPAILSTNPSREAFSLFFRSTSILDGTVEDIDKQIEQMRAKVDAIKAAITFQRKMGNVNESEHNRYNLALEYAEFGKTQLEKGRENKVNYARMSWDSMLKSMTPLPTSSDASRYSDSYIPDWAKDIFFDKSEQDRRSQELINEARSNRAYWSLSSMLSLSPAAFRAAKTVLKEYSNDKIEKEKNRAKQANEIIDSHEQ